MAKRKMNTNGKKNGSNGNGSRMSQRRAPAPVSRVTVSTAKKTSSRKIRARAPILSAALLAPATVTSTTLPVTPVVREPDPIPSAYIDRGLPIPNNYGYDRLVALVRDSKIIFTYWELNNGRMPQVHSERGQDFIDACAWVLRLYRLNENIAIDVEIDPAIGNWYFNVGGQGRYQVEMGLLSPDGEWISLLVSQIIETPRSAPSDIIDEEWRLRPEDEEALMKLLKQSAPEETAVSGSGFTGASRMRSSFSLVSSLSVVGSSMSGRPVAGSWALSMLGASRVSGSSAGSGGFGWMVAPNGALEPALERPLHTSGPNWNAQPELPVTGSGKTQQPHFKVKLPRRLVNITAPKTPTWPPVAPPKGRAKRK